MASLQVELQLGAVEGALARQHLDLGMPAAARGALQLLLGHVPDLVRAERAASGRSASFTRVQLQAEVARRRAPAGRTNFVDLRLDLVLAAEDVGVVLGEGAHPHDAVQGAGRLVAVAGAELGHAQRQVAVATSGRG